MTTPPKTPPRLSASTVIEADKTRAEIEKYLRSRDVRPPIVLTEDPDNDRIVLLFKLFGRSIRIHQPLPRVGSKVIQAQAAGNGWRPPSAELVTKRMEAETRRRWRVLFLRVKTRLDLVFDEADLEEREEMFRHEFLADTQTPDGPTVAEWMEPQVAEAYKVGRPIQMLPQPAPYKQPDSYKQLERGDV